MSILLRRNFAKCMTDMAAGHCRKRFPLAWERQRQRGDAGPGTHMETPTWWALNQGLPCLLPRLSAASHYFCRLITNQRKGGWQDDTSRYTLSFPWLSAGIAAVLFPSKQQLTCSSHRTGWTGWWFHPLRCWTSPPLRPVPAHGSLRRSPSAVSSHLRAGQRKTRNYKEPPHPHPRHDLSHLTFE